MKELCFLGRKEGETYSPECYRTHCRPRNISSLKGKFDKRTEEKMEYEGWSDSTAGSVLALYWV